MRRSYWNVHVRGHAAEAAEGGYLAREARAGGDRRAVAYYDHIGTVNYFCRNGHLLTLVSNGCSTGVL